MQVTIDGVPYTPACAISSRIGIAITTHNRADVLKRAIEQHQKHLPAGALVVVVDDGSKPAAVVVPHGVQLLRHETSLGIVASKNASLSALMDAGCEHLFLWDDDAWPIADIRLLVQQVWLLLAGNSSRLWILVVWGSLVLLRQNKPKVAAWRFDCLSANTC